MSFLCASHGPSKKVSNQMQNQMLSFADPGSSARAIFLRQVDDQGRLTGLRLWYDIDNNPRTGNIIINFYANGASSIIGYFKTSGEPTMNLGFMYLPSTGFTYQDREYTSFEIQDYANQSGSGIIISDQLKGQVVRHEFGHAIGMFHEHQNYLGGTPIQFNTLNIYTRLQGLSTSYSDRGSCNYCQNLDRDPGFQDPSLVCQCPSGCDCTEQRNHYNNVYNNVLNPITDAIGQGSEFDNNSVMMYAFDNLFIQGCENVSGNCTQNPTKSNSRFSAIDTEWIQRIYPLAEENQPTIFVSFWYPPGHTRTRLDQLKEDWVNKIISEDLDPICGINFELEQGAFIPPPDLTDITDPNDSFTIPSIPGLEHLSDVSRLVVYILIGIFSFIGLLLFIAMIRSLFKLDRGKKKSI